MKYVVAVSGGVDSVVLLDMLVAQERHELTVAHFDHGIRADSAADARFVAALATHYGVPFVSIREELGESASEELARTRRYAFLRRVAAERSARIVTAHHQDDLVESVAINLHRGTGWRGLAVLASEDIDRPLLPFQKQELYDYALRHELEWVEDETNRQAVYLRNRIRHQLSLTPSLKRRMKELRERQCTLRAEIDMEAQELLDKDTRNNRYFFTMLDEASALELLRHVTANNRGTLARPQLRRLLLAIKTARPGTTMEVGDRVVVRFMRTQFIVNHSS